MPENERPSHPTSFRLSPRAVAMLIELSAEMGLARSAVIEQAIRQLHRREVGKRPGRKSENSP